MTVLLLACVTWALLSFPAAVIIGRLIATGRRGVPPATTTRTDHDATAPSTPPQPYHANDFA